MHACVQDDLAANVTLEQGKTLPDARGDVFRGLGGCQRVNTTSASAHFNTAISMFKLHG